MDHNGIEGTAKDLAGKAQESLGRALGDAKAEAEGAMSQVRGTAQDLYGKARDGTSNLADAASQTSRDAASSLESVIRDSIENQPYTAVAIALGLGWLFGRMHRPL